MHLVHARARPQTRLDAVVKTHVSHIYAKLDVHSHQELIDLVERQG
ncbi:hypothetical protein GT610_13515 [Eggerthella sp. BIOML-A3]|nr:hypothetical protein [Eggerthella sp. BIOML-A3]MZK00380.1 hypothetical protein [Eggerthella sp. BIOML-A1]MZK36437.1 hypothetical protein [Eggerthella sp. BIOML-A5]